MNSETRKRRSTSVDRSERRKLYASDSDDGDGGNVVLKSQCSINDLPVECIKKIISYFPRRQWPRLELVNQKFHYGALACWRCLKEVQLKEYPEKRLVERDEEAEKQCLLSILRMTQIRSPNVRMIDGFGALSCTLDANVMEEISKFNTLKSVAFSYCKFRHQDLAAFLANSQSRGELEELRVTNSKVCADDEAIRRSLIDIDGRPGLRLKTFQYEIPDCPYPCSLLSGLDVSKLETLSITGSDSFRSTAVADLLVRCTQLKDLAVGRHACGQAAIKAFLNALKSLPSPNLRKLGLSLGYLGFDESAAVEALKGLAHRCPKVEEMDILGDNSDAILSLIGECFVNLKELRIGVDGFSNEAFARLTTRLGQLKKLSLHCENGSRLVEGMIAAIAVNMNSLISLHLDLPPVLTNDAISKLAGMNLKELSVNFRFVGGGAVIMCEQLGPIMVSVDFGITLMNDRLLVAATGNNVLSRVRRISLKHTSITDLSLNAIGDSCPMLEELNIEKCDVTANGIRGMIEKCKKLTHLKVHRELPGLLELIRDSTVTIETRWCQCATSLHTCLSGK